MKKEELIHKRNRLLMKLRKTLDDYDMEWNDNYLILGKFCNIDNIINKQL